jgi:hypothetical protein
VIIAPAPGLPIPPQVRDFVLGVLAWNLSLARAESSAVHSGLSTTLKTMSAMELGFVGNGNEGTKPLGRLRADPELRQKYDPDALGMLRYQNLTGADLQTADAIVTDGKGIVLADVTLERRVFQCTLAQRVAFLVGETVDAKRYQRWLGKIAAKDSAPAMQDAERMGQECLQSAARAWFAIE